jgi:outer membrane protein OmpA-like peptidoglycan-associated protein
MKLSFAILVLVALIIGGCGASKDYVAEQIQASESQMEAKIANVRETAEANEAEISKLRSLAGELQEKTDMAINEAKGFENYQVIWSGEINFPFDSWEITGAAEQTLMDAGDKMTQYPGSIIEIAGHTDRTGPAKYNLMLGEERADAAKRFLADKFGISFYRMFKMSYGESKPTAMPDEKNSASRNRRVTLKIWGNM